MIFNIWPDKPPGAITDEPEGLLPDKGDGVDRVCHVSVPQIEVRLAQNSAGLPLPAVLICPGGGYNILAYNKEGTFVADWLNSLGFSAIILKYRVPDNREGAFKDVQRAMSFIRSKSLEFKIDPKKLGVLGFSAGGHLAARLSNNYDRRSYECLDNIDHYSCKPSFTVLVYCAYLLNEAGQLKDEVCVNEQTPETFLIHAQDDTITAMSSINYYAALTKYKIASELHLFPEGGHGFGLGLPNTIVAKWPELCGEWLMRIYHNLNCS